MNSFNMFEICKSLMKQIPHEQLNALFIDELKKRKTNTDIIKTFPNELRQLCFAMNINSKSYHDLNYKLSEKINL